MEESVFLTAARLVLQQSGGQALSPKEIVRRADDQGLLPDRLDGKTPDKTLTSKLSGSIRRGGSESPFARVGPNRFILRAALEDVLEYKAVQRQKGFRGELVACVPTSHLAAVVRTQGFVSISRVAESRVVVPELVTLLPREIAEQTEDWKQLVTYCLVYLGDRLLSYVRGSYTNTEKELRGRRCVGFGGHVNSSDVVLSASGGPDIRSAAARELREELRLHRADTAKDWVPEAESIEVLGYINDDSSPAGRRHLAIVCACHVPAIVDRFERGEQSIKQLRLHDLNRGERLTFEGLEYWSEIALRALHARAFDAGVPIVRATAPRTLNRPCSIIIVGEIGSGKSELAEQLAVRLGGTALNSGREVAALLAREPVSHSSRSEFQAAAASAFVGDRAGELGVHLANRAASIGDLVVIDGIRLRKTLLAFRRREEEFGRSTFIVFVETPPHRAYEFYCRREEFESSRRLSLACGRRASKVKCAH